MPIITVRPPLPFYVSLAAEAEWPLTLAVVAMLLIVILGIGLSRRARGSIQ